MSSDTTTRNRLQAFRVRRDDFFKSEPDSPLTPEQKERFTSLDYFPENPALTLELPLDTSGEGIGEVLTIGTTDGQAKPFERAGRITFEVKRRASHLHRLQGTGPGPLLPALPRRHRRRRHLRRRPLPGHPGTPKRRPAGRLQLRLQPLLRLW